jgi:hypothetical protein
VTLHVNGNEHTIHFPKKNSRYVTKRTVKSTEIRTLMIGSIEIPIQPPETKYAI